MKQDRLPVFQRLAAGLLGLGVVIAIASGVVRHAERQAAPPEPKGQTVSSDPIRQELRRCSALTNEEALEDQRCQRAWVINRQRFFGSHPEMLENLEPEKAK